MTRKRLACIVLTMTTIVTLFLTIKKICLSRKPYKMVTYAQSKGTITTDSTEINFVEQSQLHGIFAAVSERPFLTTSVSTKILSGSKPSQTGSKISSGSQSSQTGSITYLLSSNVPNSNQYLITWYKLPHFIHSRPHAAKKQFSNCKCKNCFLSKKVSHLVKSDAVIFDGRGLPAEHPFERPVGQVWIFAEHESPITYDYGGGYWQSPQYRHVFNWTMTYDDVNTDVFLPYGEFREAKEKAGRDFLAIAQNKTKDAVIITSHCDTHSKRMEYIEKLSKYITVDVLGSCGKKWDCGELWTHDDECFSFLNSSYRYYLAFENALCRGYRTEKLFENFKYDIMIVTRGDMSSFVDNKDEATDAYISTSKFASVEELGNYLKSVSDSPEKYAKLLEKKSKYISVSYDVLYEKALCDICERMNFQDKYYKEIKDLRTWRDVDSACHEPKDMSTL